MTILDNGQYRPFKSKKPVLCDCTVGQDPNSHQPHLLKCKNTAEIVWFSRQWFQEIIKESSEPIYDNFGYRCCKTCFEKLKECQAPSDLDRYRELHKKNKEKT